jgi:hypothetical protein
MPDTLFRCQHCGQTIRKPQRWQPDPQQHATITQAAKELGLSRQGAHNLVTQRWLTVAGIYYGKKAKSLAAGVTYVTRESINEAANRRPLILSTVDKKRILQTLSDIGVIGALLWPRRRYEYEQYEHA